MRFVTASGRCRHTAEATLNAGRSGDGVAATARDDHCSQGSGTSAAPSTRAHEFCPFFSGRAPPRRRESRVLLVLLGMCAASPIRVTSSARFFAEEALASAFAAARTTERKV